MTGMPLIAPIPNTPEPIVSSRYHHSSMSGKPDAVNKIGVLADVVGEIYHTYAEARATQLIYCETVMVYAEIKREVMLRGIPADQIAFIQDYHTKTKKAALFAAINNGSIRVLLASKQSTGMNVQKRLIALHHLDCPWRPGDLEQREGRILRQGNLFPEVMVFAYVTERSFDGFRWVRRDVLFSIV
jgi:Helicase conserved C-terminal domain